MHELKNTEVNLKSVPFQINSNRMSILHFDDAKYGSAICDVAIAITNLFISKANGADINGIKYFIASYYGIDNKIKKA